MAGFYIASYAGIAGNGGGAFYIGNGIMTGTDIAGGIYDGSYEQQAGRLNGTALLRIPNGGTLVTGKQVTAEDAVTVQFSLPTYFSNGEAHLVNVDGQHVNVVFTKVRDLP